MRSQRLERTTRVLLVSVVAAGCVVAAGRAQQATGPAAPSLSPPRVLVNRYHRGMNFRFSPATAAVLERIMKAAGVSTVVEPESVISGAVK